MKNKKQHHAYPSYMAAGLYSSRQTTTFLSLQHQINPRLLPRYSFIAAHRGGPLTKDHHRKLMWWARECAAHVLPLLSGTIDSRLVYALQVAKDWAKGQAPTGEAMKASLGAHAAAREAANPVSIAVARSIGQGVATAHMADHSLGAALYALKAVKHAGKSIDEEREWQNKQLQQLPPAIIGLVVSTMMKKGEHFKL